MAKNYWKMWSVFEPSLKLPTSNFIFFLTSLIYVDIRKNIILINFHVQMPRKTDHIGYSGSKLTIKCLNTHGARKHASRLGQNSIGLSLYCVIFLTVHHQWSNYCKYNIVMQKTWDWIQLQHYEQADQLFNHVENFIRKCFIILNHS